jgi:hypothetical protein
MEKQLAIKTSIPGSSGRPHADIKTSLEVITIIEESPKKKLVKKKKDEWIDDPTVKLSPSRQADLSALNKPTLPRIDWRAYQVWNSKWSIKQDSAPLFRRLFEEGSDSKFSLEFLQRTRDLLSRQLDSPAQNKARHPI